MKITIHGSEQPAVPTAGAGPLRAPAGTLSDWLPFVLAFLSGSAGLAHQLLWTRRLVDLLGGTSLTFSRVTGAFFLGLALGSAIAAVIRPRREAAWRWVAGVELAVALLSIPVMASYRFAEFASLGASFQWALQWVAPALLVLPPALAMGLVIPWMITALPESSARGKNFVVALYAANTFGGLAGVAWVVGWGLTALGMTGSSVLAAAANAVVALGALALARVPAAPEALTAPAESNDGVPAAAALPPHCRTLAFISGFAVLGAEVLIQHQLAQVTINSMFSNAAVLGWVLLGLGLSALATGWFCRRFQSASARLAAAVLISAAACAVQPFLFSGLRSGVDSLPYELLPTRYFWELSFLSFVAVLPLFLACGFVFPVLLKSVGEQTGAARPWLIARLLAWNGLGGWLGTELTQHAISPQAGLWMGMPVIGFAYLAASIALVWRRPDDGLISPLSGWKPAIAGCAALLGICLFAYRSLPQVRLENGETLLACRVGPEGVVAAVERTPGDRRLLLNNTYSLGGTSAQFNQERQAHIPMLLHGSAKRVAVLGIATGSTLAGASVHPGVERIHAAELCGTVLDFASDHFGPWIRDALRAPNVNTTVEDARWLMARNRAAFDVVIGDLFLPWRTGEGRMYSREHLESVRSALAPDGLFCQWLPLFQLTRPQYDTICRTFLSVFPNAFLVRGDFYTELPIIGLVGGRDITRLDWQKITEACSRLRGGGLVTDPIARHPEGIAMMIVGPAPAPPAGPVNTLGNLWLELDAGKNVVGLQQPWFIGIPSAEYVRDAQRTAQTLIPAEFRAAHDAGQFFLTLEISAKLKLPVTTNLISQVPFRLPVALSRDTKAEWKQWPMRVKPNPSVETRPVSSARGTEEPASQTL